MTSTEPGRALYEADVAKRPLYHDRTPRKTWAQLDDIARWSWNRRAAPIPVDGITEK